MTQVTISALEKAARRVGEWPQLHGVYGAWSMNELGLRLEANYSGHNVGLTATWSDLAADPELALKLVEDRALRGLSS